MFQDIFTTTIYHKIFNFDLKVLKDFCYNIEKNQESRFISNKGGFQSSLLDFNKEPLNEISEFITNEVNFYCKFLELKPAIQGACWININRYKDFNIAHNHTPGFISAIFYVQTPEDSGKLIFEDPSRDSKKIDWNEDRVVKHNKHTAETWLITPVENSCCIFPSWINHHVEPNKSKKDRISIAFNFKPIL